MRLGWTCTKRSNRAVTSNKAEVFIFSNTVKYPSSSLLLTQLLTKRKQKGYKMAESRKTQKKLRTKNCCNSKGSKWQRTELLTSPVTGSWHPVKTIVCSLSSLSVCVCLLPAGRRICRQQSRPLFLLFSSPSPDPLHLSLSVLPLANKRHLLLGLLWGDRRAWAHPFNPGWTDRGTLQWRGGKSTD